MTDGLKERIGAHFNGKSILVTGGTGSFGKRFVRRVLRDYKPKRLIVYSRDELKQYEMAKLFPEEKYPCMRYFLGDVRDQQRLMRALPGVDVVIHAAALKHVPAAEYNPFEFIKTNVLGAQNLIESCIDSNVKRVVALSTDKACNPVNMYGSTKLCSDKLFVAGNSYAGETGPRFTIVRYGNVMGSRGSVIPFFMNLRGEGVLPITDERMTRFWITLDEGIELVFHALVETQGGEIFVPKIPSMRVTELKEAIAPECKIKIIGTRPGEKLHECMISEDDAPYTEDFDAYYVINPVIRNWPQASKPRKGKPVPEGFRYSSEINDRWLNRNQLLDILANYKLVGQELIRLDEVNDAAKASVGLRDDV